MQTSCLNARVLDQNLAQVAIGPVLGAFSNLAYLFERVLWFRVFLAVGTWSDCIMLNGD